jgi:hypothetical protein
MNYIAKLMKNQTGFRLKTVRTAKSKLCDVFSDLPWYGWWLRDQLSLQPDSTFDCLPGFDRKSEDSLTSTFSPLCLKISLIIKYSEAPSISNIVESLLEDGSISAGDEY